MFILGRHNSSEGFKHTERLVQSNFCFENIDFMNVIQCDTFFCLVILENILMIATQTDTALKLSRSVEAAPFTCFSHDVRLKYIDTRISICLTICLPILDSSVVQVQNRKLENKILSNNIPLLLAVVVECDWLIITGKSKSFFFIGLAICVNAMKLTKSTVPLIFVTSS